LLDLLLIRKPTNIEKDIFRKPITTDITTNFLSRHPIEHKISEFRYYITRMHSLPSTSERKQKEWTLIQQIAQNNDFQLKLVQNLNLQVQRKQTNHDQNNNDKNKTKQNMGNIYIQYYSPIIRKVTNIFEHTNVETSFKNTSTIQQLTKPKNKIMMYRNRIWVEFTNSHVTQANCHISGRQLKVSNKDIKSILSTWNIMILIQHTRYTS
jgi:hypothetical protein